MAETETVEGEVVEEIEESAVVPVEESPAALALRDEHDIDAFVRAALNEWKAYQRLTVELLDDSDYQKIGNRRFKKKSAWRKYAKAFRVSCVALDKEITRDDTGYPLYARMVVRASTPDGRFQDAEQECHVTERCCPTRTGGRCPKAAWQNHYCCTRDCDGKTHFSHPGDLPATAFTRAKNRAISDLIGAGEVSYEEMKDTEAPTRAAPKARAKSTPAPPPQEQRPAPPPPQTRPPPPHPAGVPEPPVAAEDREPCPTPLASEVANALLGLSSNKETVDFLRNNVPKALLADNTWSLASLQKALTKDRAQEMLAGLQALED